MIRKYSIFIQWCENDSCFVVTFPEWGEHCQTYGDTYEEALKNAREVLELMIQSSLAEGAPLPKIKTFNRVGALNTQR